LIYVNAREVATAARGGGRRTTGFAPQRRAKERLKQHREAIAPISELYTETAGSAARALEKRRVYRRAAIAFTKFLPAVGTLAGTFRGPRARPMAAGAPMLKNSLIFAVAALAIAFSAPSLLPQRATGVSAPAVSGPVAPAPVAPVATTAAAAGDFGYRQASITADAGGQFHTNALIDGQDVSLVVDTGATMVALTADTAERLGVVVDPSTPKLRVNTANGVSFVSPVVLRQVSLGSIYMDDVRAVVMPPGAGTADLLGASFLKRLVSVEQRDGVLVLRQ